jgi:hypothetical protein
MFKALTPIVGIIVAVGLFFTYIQPTFKDVKGIQDETGEYAQAIEQASALQKRIRELTDQKTSIPIANLERLQALLPDRVNEVSALIDLDALATLHHLKLGDIAVGGNQDTKKTGANTQKQPTAAPSVGMPGGAAAPDTMMGALTNGGFGAVDKNTLIRDQYTGLDIGFSVSGSYNDFRMFLADIERSLVLMEVTKITFGKSEGDTTPFMMGIRLYSLNPLVSSTISTNPSAP